MRFFFYGTLIAGSGNAVACHVHTRLHPIGAATVRGALHAIPDLQGWYPALVPGNGSVRGVVYEAAPGFTAADLALLDRWEDYDPARPGESVYLRQSLSATLAAGGKLEAQGYVHARPLPECACAIPGGDFAAWLGARGGKAFA